MFSYLKPILHPEGKWRVSLQFLTNVTALPLSNQSCGSQEEDCPSLKHIERPGTAKPDLACQDFLVLTESSLPEMSCPCGHMLGDAQGLTQGMTTAWTMEETYMERRLKVSSNSPEQCFVPWGQWIKPAL